MAIVHYIKAAQKEIFQDWNREKIERVGVHDEESGILFSKTRLTKTMKLGDILTDHSDLTTEIKNMEINPLVPVLPRNSPLYIAAANHIHWNVAGSNIIELGRERNHKSAYVDHLISLKFMFAQNGILIFHQIKAACVPCAVKTKKKT